MIDSTKNWLVIKNDDGKYLLKDYKEHPPKMNFISSEISASKYCGSHHNDIEYTVFKEARELNGRVFIMTRAGDIEIFERDFKIR